MFEKEIKFIVDFNLNKIRKSGTFFNLEKLNYSGVHPAIIQYISTELDLMIFEERKKLLQNSMFDYTTHEVTRYFELISQEVKRNKRISYEDIKKLIIQAVSFNVNYVVRPRWSLSKLIFDPSPTRHTDEIRILLNYPYYYTFLKEIVLAYLSKKKVTSLTVEEFNDLITKIDKEMLAAGSEKFIDNALNAITDLFNEGMAVKDRIAPELVLIFLKEKNLSEYSHRLKKALPSDAKQKYNVNEIRSIIYAKEGGKPPVLKPVKQEEEKEFKAEDIISPKPEVPKVEKKDVFIKVESKFPLIDNEELDIEEESDPVNEIEEKPKILEPFIEKKNVQEQKKNIEEADEIKQPVISEKAEPVKETSEEIPSEEKNILNETETKVAEEINLPIVEDDEVIPDEEIDESEIPDVLAEEPEKEIEIDLDRETNVTLPDEEIKKLYEEENEEKEISGKDVETDEDEIKFDIEAKDQLEELYEFEEVEDEFRELSAIDEQDFNLTEMENELKQIEEELNIHSEPPAINKKAPVQTSSTNAEDIFKFLSDKEIDKVISNIFNEDRDDFTNTLERIAECNTYEESTEILKGVFLTYRINPYSRDAVTLTNAVSKYFDQK